LTSESTRACNGAEAGGAIIDESGFKEKSDKEKKKVYETRNN
jgi:hypothetical protein